MSRLSNLITELCPRGVPHRSLGEIGVFVRGNGLRKSDLKDHGVPAIHYGQVHTHYGVWTTTTKSFVDPGVGAKLRKAQPGNLIIATTSEDDAAVGKATAWIGEQAVAVSGDAFIFRHGLDPKYVSYFFQSGQFHAQKVKHITGAKVRRLSGDSLARIVIPVPPRDVQQKIAQVLDQFAQLEAELNVELEAELEARRRQYEYYRDQLLTFPEAGGGRFGGFRWVNSERFFAASGLRKLTMSPQAASQQCTMGRYTPIMGPLRRRPLPGLGLI